MAETSPASAAANAAVDPIALHARHYLEDTVVAVLTQGLKVLVRERPENPVDFLAMYLLKNNPRQPNLVVEVPIKSSA